MKNSTLLILILVNCYFSTAQKNLNIKYENPQIRELIESYKVGQKNKKITVYRIQLSSNESPEKITWFKDKYKQLFPLENVEEIFEPPYFKAITGIYLDKKIAAKKLAEIKKIFKSAFIFKESIAMGKYIENNLIN